MNRIELHEEICKGLHELYEKKNSDYGDSFVETWKEDGYAMVRTRLYDKFSRFKTLSKQPGKQKVKDESIEDTLLDLANYAIMTVVEMRMEKEENKSVIQKRKEL